MFDSFPFLLGKKLNYHQYLSLISMLIFFAFALGFYILYLIFKRFEEYFTMRKLLSGLNKDDKLEDPSQPILPESIPTSNDKFKLAGRYNKEGSKDSYPSENQEAFGNATYQKSKLVKTLYWVSYFWSLLSMIFLSFTPLCWSAFGKLPIAGAVFLLLFIYYHRFFNDVMEFRPNSVKNLKNKDHENPIIFQLKYFARINIVTFRRYKIFYIGANILIIFFAIFLPFLFQNTCVTFHNPVIGWKIGSADVSTKITRQTALDDRCPPGVPCHVYVTLPENATDAVFLNFHTNQKHTNAQVFNDTKEHYQVLKTLRNQVPVKRFDPELEAKGSRYVYSALINNLQPNNSYAFGIFYDGTYQVIKFYYTMPESIVGNESLVFVNGGDVGSSSSVQDIANNFVSYMPNILFVGGDIAYDNGLTSCYHAWDNFLSMIDTIVVSSNRLIPIVLAVGNHDVGLNSLSETNISLSTSETPLYFQFFPQHFKQDDKGKSLAEVPEISERRTYFNHRFSGVVFYTLDSGFISTFQGYQSRWLNESLSNNSNLLKFVQYHNPSYSGCNLPSNLARTSNVQSLMFWNNLFDKYNVTTVYEHHNHVLKRTWRIKGYTENSNGTLYLGDGGWGDVNNKCSFDNEGFYASIQRKQHVWVSQIREKIINYTAIGVNGTIYDNDYISRS